MAWYFSLHITDCDHQGQAVAGAVVTDLQGGGGYTDDYGQFTGVVNDDDVDGWRVEVAHDGYEARVLTIYKAQANTTIEACLHVPGSRQSMRDDGSDDAQYASSDQAGYGADAGQEVPAGVDGGDGEYA